MPCWSLPSCRRVPPSTGVPGSREWNDLRETPGVEHYVTVVGYNFLDAVVQPNSLLIIPTLKPFADRTDASLSASGDHRPPQPRTGDHSASRRVRFQPAAHHRSRHRRRLRVSAQLPGRRGAGGPGGGHARDVVAANEAGNRERVQYLRRQYTADLPGHRSRQGADARPRHRYVFQALQSTLGRYYINDFNLFGRAWQVNIQGEERDRAKIDSFRIHVQNNEGAMVPIRSIVDASIVFGPQTIVRYNNYRSVTINGGAAPGYSSGQAMAAM